ncbi:MAG: hypothetical protein H7Y86_14690 [Rhizobacter sp.]|nr:hypothetical protein [Ferruginibacter sp.]
MKQKFLSILSVLLFTTILVNAQDLTTYRGAFAPAPTRQWTEDWTNWDPQNTPYGVGLPVVPITTDISASTTWTSGNVYVLTGTLFVKNNAVLTIEPGTIIKGSTTTTVLVIARGAKIVAEGTPCRPIVFTSNQAAGSRASGDWSGLVLLGRAKHNLGTANQIEGIAPGDPNSLHGGTDDDDNSGTLKYVRIEYSGFAFTTNNEINGLTMGSIGRGTTIDYVQVTLNNDDAFEWFGGSVNCKHLIAYQCLDDDWDTDNGYSGIVQYALSIKAPGRSDASQSEGFESDNSATGVHLPILPAGTPKTSAKFYNVTQIGAFRCASNADFSGQRPGSFLHRRGARLRRNTDLKIYNSILMNNWRGLFIDDAVVGTNPTQPTTINFNEDSAVFRNNIIAGDFTSVWSNVPVNTYGNTTSLAYEDVPSRTIGTFAVYGNDSLNTCSLLTDAWNANPALADLRPNAAFVSNNPAYTSNPVTDLANLSTGADLTPIPVIESGLYTANQSRDFVAVVLENGGNSATNGQITITIPKPSGWDIKVPGIATLTATPVQGPVSTSLGGPNNNTQWDFRDDGTNVIATSRPGVIIPRSDVSQVGFIATRKLATGNGTTQNLSINVSGGGDTTPLNNGALTSLSAN